MSPWSNSWTAGIVVREFEPQLHYNIPFRYKYPWERYEPPYSSIYGLNTVLLLSFKKKKMDLALYNPRWLICHKITNIRKFRADENIIENVFEHVLTKGFANGPEDQGSIPGQVIPKTQKMGLDASLLNTLHYKLRIKSKVLLWTPKHVHTNSGQPARNYMYQLCIDMGCGQEDLSGTMNDWDG